MRCTGRASGGLWPWASRTPLPGHRARGGLRSLSNPPPPPSGPELGGAQPRSTHCRGRTCRPGSAGGTPSCTTTGRGSLCSLAHPKHGGKHAARSRCSARSQRARAFVKKKTRLGLEPVSRNRLTRGPEPKVKDTLQGPVPRKPDPNKERSSDHRDGPGQKSRFGLIIRRECFYNGIKIKEAYH